MRDTVEQLQEEVKALRETLSSLIAWMVQSSVSPITAQEAKLLLTKLERSEP